ncbi:MAG TPA: DUF4383 domain-containing protein [Terriglobales bacterium]
MKDLAGMVHFVPAHNIFHIASGILGLYSGIRGKKLPIAFARVFGLVYTAIGVLGFVHMAQLEPLQLNAVYNVVHLLVGIAGLAVGFMGAKSELATAQKSGA